MIEHLIVGSGGYIGRNLAQALRGQRVASISRSVEPSDDAYRVDLSAEPLSPDHPIFRLRPRQVYLLARPATVEYTPNRTFHDNLQRLLLAWCSGKELERVHLASTTLVYSGDEPIPPSAAQARTQPLGAYEYWKLELELFLGYLSAAVNTEVDYFIWRLPLVFGGEADLGDVQTQFIYRWIDDHRQGLTWPEPWEAEARFGTSWVYLPDFVALLQRLEPGQGGLHVRHAASGFFSYAELRTILRRRFPGATRERLHLHRTRFEIGDEAGLPARELAERIDAMLDAHGVTRPSLDTRETAG